MNAAQVNEAWRKDKEMREQRAVLQRLADEHQRAMRWSRVAFPDRVENGWPCPFAAELAAREARRSDGKVSRSRVERALLARVRRLGDELDPWWPRVNKTTKEMAA